jgi:hypothetical protein
MCAQQHKRGKELNILAASQIKKKALVHGYCAGDQVVSLIAHADWLKIGNEGVVVGPGTSTRADAADQLLVAFGGKELNILAASHIRKKALVHGYCAGDKVVSLVAHEDWLKIGNEGVVVGPGTIQGAADRLLVAFGGKDVNILAASQIKKKALVHGYCAGDQVVSLIAYDDWLTIGKEGVVVGPGTSEGADVADRLMVAFGGREVNMLAASQIKKKAKKEAEEKAKKKYMYLGASLARVRLALCLAAKNCIACCRTDIELLALLCGQEQNPI